MVQTRGFAALLTMRICLILRRREAPSRRMKAPDGAGNYSMEFS